jgi:succinate dehydrogenase/fumarate reductase flavoprotein subunit
MMIKARKAVILTCGGFSGSQEMLATYISEAPALMYPTGTPYNTGDGLRVAMSVGASLWHMTGIEWARQSLKIRDLPAAFWLQPRGLSWINVNQDGRRIRNETISYAHAKKHLEVLEFETPIPIRRASWPHVPWYLVFDEKVRLSGPIVVTQKFPRAAPFVTYNTAYGLYSWSTDNASEIEKGWIHYAETFAGLARKMGIKPEELTKTLSQYNRNCKQGVDPEFGRAHLEALDTPPYYAIECVLGIINTQGGPRRNAHGQVMDSYGKPIQRLYSGGELGSIWGFLYPGACNLPECLVSGILAADHATSLSPWD